MNQLCKLLTVLCASAATAGKAAFTMTAAMLLNFWMHLIVIIKILYQSVIYTTNSLFKQYQDHL